MPFFYVCFWFAREFRRLTENRDFGGRYLGLFTSQARLNGFDEVTIGVAVFIFDIHDEPATIMKKLTKEFLRG